MVVGPGFGIEPRVPQNRTCTATSCPNGRVVAGDIMPARQKSVKKPMWPYDCPGPSLRANRIPCDYSCGSLDAAARPGDVHLSSESGRQPDIGAMSATCHKRKSAILRLTTSSLVGCSG